MKFSEIVRDVISQAKAVQQERAADPVGDDSPILSSGGDLSTMTPPRLAAEQSLRVLLERLPPDVVYMLTAIMYLGRGDFPAEELQQHYHEIRDTFGDARWAARQMVAKQMLPEYLASGLKKLGDAGVNVDTLFTA